MLNDIKLASRKKLKKYKKEKKLIINDKSNKGGVKLNLFSFRPNRELQQKNRELQEENQSLDTINTLLLEQNSELQEQNKMLKEQNLILQDRELEKENKELQEKNKELNSYFLRVNRYIKKLESENKILRGNISSPKAPSPTAPSPLEYIYASNKPYKSINKFITETNIRPPPTVPLSYLTRLKPLPFQKKKKIKALPSLINRDI